MISRCGCIINLQPAKNWFLWFEWLTYYRVQYPVSRVKTEQPHAAAFENETHQFGEIILMRTHLRSLLFWIPKFFHFMSVMFFILETNILDAKTWASIPIAQFGIIK